MMWHWYVGRKNELLLDLDSDRSLAYAKERLSRNGEPFLNVRWVDLYPSAAANHYHMIVTLRGPLAAIDRTTWELHLGSDIVRVQYNLMRVRRGLEDTADFLIADRVYPFRKPDHTCECEGKHKDKKITSSCPVLRVLLGSEASAQYFAIRPKAKLSVGRIPLSKIFQSEKEKQ